MTMDALNAEYRCPVHSTADLPAARRAALLERPVKTSADILALVQPILQQVREHGDEGLRQAVVKFDRCVPAENKDWDLALQAPFPDHLAKIDQKVKEAIDVAYHNIKVSLRSVTRSSGGTLIRSASLQAFHSAQMDREAEPIRIETMPGVVCQRFARPIGSVGLYVSVFSARSSRQIHPDTD